MDFKDRKPEQIEKFITQHKQFTKGMAKMMDKVSEEEKEERMQEFLTKSILFDTIKKDYLKLRADENVDEISPELGKVALSAMSIYELIESWDADESER